MATKKQKHISKDGPRTVVIYTDGSCYPNPNGQGGWAFYCALEGKQAVRYGCSRSSTNNEMELTAILHALLYVPAGPEFTYPFLIFTDSQYCRRALTEWVHGWKQANWRTATGKPVKNQELIQRIDALIAAHSAHRPFELRWVRGHVGIPENELVDQRANFGRKQQRTNWKPTNNKNKNI